MKDPIEEFLNYIIVEKGLSRNSVEAYQRDLIKYEHYLKEQGREMVGARRESHEVPG